MAAEILLVALIVLASVAAGLLFWLGHRADQRRARVRRDDSRH
ncbi:MAG: hypothetical protein WAX29_12335 [Propionibacterium sp.]